MILIYTSRAHQSCCFRGQTNAGAAPLLKSTINYQVLDFLSQFSKVDRGSLTKTMQW